MKYLQWLFGALFVIAAPIIDPHPFGRAWWALNLGWVLGCCSIVAHYEARIRDKPKKDIAFVGLACGRLYLSVAGVVVAMEGDACREADLPADIVEKAQKEYPSTPPEYFYNRWHGPLLEWVAREINEKAQH